ncbi:MAG TPA: hypothetical protein DCS87_11290 [Rheinheimera sp.]|nr:hypothetical protein [Rheinheimera sp.]
MKSFAGTLYGLNIHSDIQLPFCTPLDAAAPDISVELTTPLPLPFAAGHQVSQTHSCIQSPWFGRQTLQRSDSTMRLLVEPLQDVTSEHLITFVLGSGLGSALHWLDRLPLHGTAIATPRGAALFLGASGSGKSSLALLAASCGVAVLSDDVIPLQRWDQQWWVDPAHGRLKVDRGTAEALGYPTTNLSTTAPTISKLALSLPPESLGVRQPVWRIYLLNAMVADEGTRHAVHRLQAVPLLTNQIYRLSTRRQLPAWASTLQDVASLALQAPVFQLQLPRVSATWPWMNYQQWFRQWLSEQLAVD